jgi:hypothetical protein
MTPRTLVLECEQTEGGHGVLLRRPDLGRRVDAIAMHDFGAADLAPYAGLLIWLHCDQRHLHRHRDRLAAFLAQGGTIVFCGHVATPFLDGLSPYRPLPAYRVADLVVNLEREHPVWAGVRGEDLTFRRGVAGFYGRGHNPPPPGAIVINTLGDARVPVDLEWRPAVGGRVLMHAGADLWMYLETETTAARMGVQLLDWIEEGDK